MKSPPRGAVLRMQGLSSTRSWISLRKKHCQNQGNLLHFSPQGPGVSTSRTLSKLKGHSGGRACGHARGTAHGHTYGTAHGHAHSTHCARGASASRCCRADLREVRGACKLPASLFQLDVRKPRGVFALSVALETRLKTPPDSFQGP